MYNNTINDQRPGLINMTIGPRELTWDTWERREWLGEESWEDSWEESCEESCPAADDTMGGREARRLRGFVRGFERGLERWFERGLEIGGAGRALLSGGLPSRDSWENSHVNVGGGIMRNRFVDDERESVDIGEIKNNNTPSVGGGAGT